MIKPLILPCAIILLACALLSSWLNFQSPSAEARQRDFIDLSSQQKPKDTWADVLAKLPQYRETLEVKAVPEVVRQPKISDSKIIGIVVDKPKSVLLLIDDQSEAIPKQLNIGEGWLENWIIRKIAPDSISWVNTLTQEDYTQTLFAAPTDNSEDSKPKTGN